jgi:hypothetical protein
LLLASFRALCDSQIALKTEQKSNSDIAFKPLTQGLGFHPFADGLPYAPTQNPTPSQGTGAVSAGKPSFAYPPVQAQVQATPINTPSIDRIRKELEALAQARAKQNAAPASAITTPARPVTSLMIKNRPLGLGYSITRVAAYLIDSAFNLSICAAILSTALVSSDIEALGLYQFKPLFIAGMFLFLCNWSLIAAQEVAFGTSLGKRIFGLRLEGTGMEVFMRAVLFIPSLLFSGLGILIAVFDSRKRCWHDQATQLQPESIT